jgi:hypothetical protein
MSNPKSSKVTQQLTVSTTAVGFDKTTMDKVYSVHGRQLAGVTGSVSGGDVRFKYAPEPDDVKPTAALGTIISAGTTFMFTSEEEARGVMFIRKDVSDATIDATFLYV